MNTRSFASLNIACETLKMEIENEWGRSRGALCYMLTGTTVFVTLKNGNKVYKYESLLVREKYFLFNIPHIHNLLFLLCFKGL